MTAFLSTAFDLTGSGRCFVLIWGEKLQGFNSRGDCSLQHSEVHLYYGNWRSKCAGDMCQVCDTDATSRHFHDLSWLVRDARVFPWERGWDPPVKIKAPPFIFLTGKLRKSLLLLALEKNKQNKATNKTNPSRCTKVLLQISGTPSNLGVTPMSMCLLSALLTCFTCKGKTVWVPATNPAPWAETPDPCVESPGLSRAPQHGLAPAAANSISTYQTFNLRLSETDPSSKSIMQFTESIFHLELHVWGEPSFWELQSGCFLPFCFFWFVFCLVVFFPFPLSDD